MNDFILIIILLPIIFMLHEFEEIICFKPWIEKNQSWLITKYPLFSKLVAHLNEMSVPTFAMLVLEEFILVSIVTITALTLHWYNIWVAIFTAFAFHILIHIIQWIIIRKYIPVIITSLLALPYIFWVLNTILKEIPINCIILLPLLSFCSAMFLYFSLHISTFYGHFFQPVHPILKRQRVQTVFHTDLSHTGAA